MMVCPRCRSNNYKVIDSRNESYKLDGIFRARKCLDCGFRWETREVYSYLVKDASEEKEK